MAPVCSPRPWSLRARRTSRPGEEADARDHDHVERPSGPAAEIGGPARGRRGHVRRPRWRRARRSTTPATPRPSTPRPAPPPPTSRRRTRCPATACFELEPAGEGRLRDPDHRAPARRPRRLQRHRRAGVAQRERRRRLVARVHLPRRRAPPRWATPGWACRRSASASRAATSRCPCRTPRAPGSATGSRRTTPSGTGRSSHPGDAFAYDIFTQVGRALLSPGSAGPARGTRGASSCWPSASHSPRPRSRPTSTACSRSPRCSTASSSTAASGRGRRWVPRARASSIVDVFGGEATVDPHRRSGARDRGGDRDRRRGLLGYLAGPPARRRSLPAVGDRRHRARRSVPDRRAGRDAAAAPSRSTTASRSSRSAPRSATSAPGRRAATPPPRPTASRWTRAARRPRSCSTTSATHAAASARRCSTRRWTSSPGSRLRDHRSSAS